MTSSATAVAPLVHATVQELVRRAAHDVRNLMNGVAVNLEVVRSRSARPGAEVAAVRPFAEAASQQFESLCNVTEALLAIARPAREPFDVAREWSTLEALRAMLPLDEGRTWSYDGPSDGGTATGTDANAARLALAAAMLAALDAEGNVRCTVRVDRAIDFTIASNGIGLSDGIATALAAAGIAVGRNQSVITLTFPTLVA